MRCSISIMRLLGLMVLAIVMVGASLFCANQPLPDGKIAGWFGVFFFGAAFFVMVGRLFFRGPAVVLDEVGILDRRAFSEVILWSDIDSVRIVTYRGHRFLGIELKDPVAFASRLSSRRRWFGRMSERMGFPIVTLGFNELSPGLDAVWSYVQEHHPEKVPPAREV